MTTATRSIVGHLHRIRGRGGGVQQSTPVSAEQISLKAERKGDMGEHRGGGLFGLFGPHHSINLTSPGARLSEISSKAWGTSAGPASSVASSFDPVGSVGSGDAIAVRSGGI